MKRYTTPGSIKMAELTPEERERIYLEEKARLEIRQELAPKKTSVGKVIGVVLLCGFGLLMFLVIIGSIREQQDDAAWKNLTPQERHQKTLQNCAELLKGWEFKTYSELSVTERQMKAACEAQLLHPDQDIIRPSH
jgi:hypothetical protein